VSFQKILELDRDWSYALRVAEKPGTRRTLAMVFAHSGDSWFWGIAMLLLWLVGNQFWKQWAVYELFWISALAALVMMLKFIIRRRRPEGEWGAIYRNTDPHSFPSGHAARAFLIAALAGLLGPAPLAIALWAWAPLVSLARVAMGVHYLSDILAGALVGLLVVWLVWPLSPQVFDVINGWVVGLLGLPLW
jgi:membrane-associated phospholipid phosphatase